MDQISLKLQHEGNFMLQGNYNGSAADFQQLARLICTDLSLPEKNPHFVGHPMGDEPPSGARIAFQSKTLKTVFDQTEKTFHLYLNTDRRKSELFFGIYIWQVGIICAAYAAISRGSKIQLMHCSMLEKGDRAVLLVGESGIGKSTTFRRWKAAGNVAVADDMILLEYLPSGEILAYHLPTWSACREGMDHLVYPFAPPVRVEGILALSRDPDKECIKEISFAEFYAQLYRNGMFHYLELVKGMSRSEQQVLTDAVRQFTDQLLKRFPCRALFAHLDGDITETLKGLL